MTFTLTREHVAKLMAATAEGDLGPFVAEADPDVVWRLGGSDEQGEGRSGVYNLASFHEKVGANFAKILPGGKMYIFADSIDVVGNKAYVEAHAESETFKAGTYKNKSVP